MAACQEAAPTLQSVSPSFHRGQGQFQMESLEELFVLEQDSELYPCRTNDILRA